MKRTESNPGPGIRKLFPVTFVQANFAIVRMAIVSVLVIGIVLILPACLSQVHAAEKVLPANPAVLPSTSLKTIVVDDYYPYTFLNDKGIPDGFSVDIAKAVSGIMDLKLIISVDTWEHATKALANGNIDFLPMMAASPERDKNFDFSAPHTIAYDAVFFRTGAKKIGSLKDLFDKTVIVMNKDAAHDYLLSSGIAVKMKLVQVDSLPDALRTLAEGKGEAALMPKLVGLIVTKNLKLTNLDPSPVVIDAYNRPFSFAVKDGNQALLERLSQGLNIIKSTGQYQEIYNKWFGTLEPSGLPWKTVIQYIAAIAAVFLLIALGLILWTVSLRRKVALRTKNLAVEIQERKQAEEALVESELQHRTLFTHMGQGFYLSQILYDENGIPCDFMYIDINPAFEKIAGLKREQIIGKTYNELVQPDPGSGWPDCFKRVAITGIPENYTFYSKIYNCYFEVYAFKSGEGRFSALVQDITERKRAEEALRYSRLQLFNALEMAHLGHWEYDVASDLFTFNDQFYKIFNTSVEKVGGYTMHSAEYARRFVHPDDMDMVGAETRKAIETSDPQYNRQIEHRMIYADGKVGFISVRFLIVKDSDGRTVKTYGVNQDITERKQAEQELQDTLENLRKAVGTTIKVMVSAVETRDPYTSGHQTRSADLARAIAMEMGLPQDKIDGIRMAGSIHDIGKLSVPAEILSKPTKLSEIEFSLIKEHARQGYEILKKIESPWFLADIVYQHHERIDGSGYPRNLKGDEILIEARILAVADVVEAMASHRPYRPGLGIDAALNEIREEQRSVL